jgi:hypothetical protein
MDPKAIIRNSHMTTYCVTGNLYLAFNAFIEEDEVGYATRESPASAEENIRKKRRNMCYF